MNKDVALVLSSGGPRGFAYIGAIEELTPPPPRAKSGISRMAKSACRIYVRPLQKGALTD